MMYFRGHDHMQRGLRPAVITQNDVGNKYSPNIIAVPLTSQIDNIKKRNQPTHVPRKTG
jgi:mRNA interferase MazF